jgi:trigger factor
VEKAGYQPYGRPTLRVAHLEPLELKIRVALQPTVELGDYCSLRVEPEPPVEVADEQVDQLLQELREEHGSWEPVTRPAQMGDQVTLDIRGTSGDEPVFDETGTTLVLSEQLTPPGFAEAVVGMQPGETKQVELAYPEDYANEDLAGKTVAFTLTLHEVKERKLPEPDDEFARSVGDYASLAELKDHLRTGLKAELEHDAQDRLETRAVDQLVEQSKVEYPNAALEQAIDRLVERQESRLRTYGFTLETYLQVSHKSMEQLRDEVRPQAERELRRSLVLRELGRAEGVRVEPEEIAREIARLSLPYGERSEEVRQALLQPEALSSISSDIFVRKAMERLVAIATGQAECAPSGAAAEQAAAAAEPPPAEPPSAG